MRWAALALAGCGGLRPFNPAGSTVDTAGEPGDVQIYGVEPDFGSNAGGLAVVIRGGGLPADPVVTFGGEEATVVSATGDEIDVETPPDAGKDGWVKVVVSHGASSGALEHAFRYWADGTGKVGTWGQFTRWQVVSPIPIVMNPTDTNGTTSGEGGYANVQFVQPIASSGWDVYAPALDSCASNYVAPSVVAIDTGATELSFHGASQEALTLPASGFLVFGSDFVPEAQMPAGTVWSLDEPDVSGDWPPFSLDSLVELPVDFKWDAPGLTTDLASLIRIDPGVTLRWSGGAPADFVAIVLVRQRGDGSGVVEVVSCAVQDTGSFTVPAATWTAWTPGGSDLVLAQLMRITVRQTAVLPPNGSTNGVLGANMVLTVYRPN